jgi:cation transport ATPase
MSQTNASASTTRISAFLLMVVFVTLALSFVALIFAVYALDQNTEAAYVLMLLGLIGVAISTYVLYQTRRRLSKLKIVVPPVLTTLECTACHEKDTREFLRGDYIFKEGEKCKKCSGRTLITAIYKEVKDKEKDKMPF